VPLFSEPIEKSHSRFESLGESSGNCVEIFAGLDGGKGGNGADCPQFLGGKRGGRGERVASHQTTIQKEEGQGAPED